MSNVEIREYRDEDAVCIQSDGPLGYWFVNPPDPIGCNRLVAVIDNRIVAVAAWRIDGAETKGINVGAFEDGLGATTVLLREICRINPGLGHYGKFPTNAWEYAEAIGMTHAETLKDGRRIYRFTPEEAAAFALLRFTPIINR